MPQGCRIDLRIIPNAKQNRVEGVYGDQIKIRLQAPPVDGKANKALIKFLSKTLEIPGKAVQVTAGAQSRNKSVVISGVSPESAVQRLKLM